MHFEHINMSFLSVFPIISSVLLLFQSIEGAEQLTGIKTIGVDFPNIASAVSALNTYHVGDGGVTFNIPAGYIEVGNNILVTDNSGTQSNQILFQKTGIGANPVIVAGAGIGAFDAVIVLLGTCYVTFDGVDIRDADSNTTATTQMEMGYALLKPSGTHGCQNNVIKNCTITLHRSNVSSTGIFSANVTSTNVSVTVSSVKGSNSFNKFYNNSISNVYSGIQLKGSSTVGYYDQSNDIGTLGGNTITNFGGADVTTYGIYGIYQNGLVINNNIIANAAAGGLASGATLYGICHATGSGSNFTVTANKITLTKGDNTGQVGGIVSNATGSVAINQNTLANWLLYGGSAINSVYGISNTGNAVFLSVSDNRLESWSCATSSPCELSFIKLTGMVSGSCIVRKNVICNSMNLISTLSIAFIANSSSSPNVICSGNVIEHNRNFGISAGMSMYGYYGSGSASNGTEILDSNIFRNLQNTNDQNNCTAIYSSGVYGTKRISYNTIDSVSGFSGNVIGIHVLNASDATVYSNILNSITGTGSVSGIISGSSAENLYRNSVSNLTGTNVSGIVINSGTTSAVYANQIFALTSQSGLANITGINVVGSTNASVYNNCISDLTAPVAQLAPALIGITIGTISKAYIYYNTVYLNASSSSSAFGSVALAVSSASFLDLRNNVLINCSIPGNGNSSAKSIVYKRSSAVLSTHGALSNNNVFFVNSTVAGKALFFDGTNIDSTLNALKTRFSPRESESISELPRFVNATVAPFNLHINSCSPTLVESGGTRIETPVSIGEDIEGNIRALETTYTGNGVAPDIGAYEFNGLNEYTLHIKAFIEGLYNQTANRVIPDTLTVELRTGNNGFSVLRSSRCLLAANGAAVAVFKATEPLDDSYFVVLKHRNSIETWSAVCVGFNCGSLSLDFTQSASVAYGYNLKKQGGGYCLYSGDVDQSGYIDNADLLLIDNDTFIYRNGDLITDIDGSKFVDNNDLLICDNNAYNFIGKCTPVGANAGIKPVINTLSASVPETLGGMRTSFTIKPPLK